MKLGSLAGARAQYYDRNASSVLNVYSATVTPHTTTVRWSYTVASGKKLLVENLSQRAIRLTAATTAQTYGTEVGMNVGGTSYAVQQIRVYVSTVFLSTIQVDHMALTLYAGEALTGATYDDSIGGTIAFQVAMKGTLFDA
jgi:hypothetical protein